MDTGTQSYDEPPEHLSALQCRGNARRGRPLPSLRSARDDVAALVPSTSFLGIRPATANWLVRIGPWDLRSRCCRGCPVSSSARSTAHVHYNRRSIRCRIALENIRAMACSPARRPFLSATRSPRVYTGGEARMPHCPTARLQAEHRCAVGAANHHRYIAVLASVTVAVCSSVRRFSVRSRTKRPHQR